MRRIVDTRHWDQPATTFRCRESPSGLFFSSSARCSALLLSPNSFPLRLSPAPGTALSNRWKYYQYLNLDLKTVPRMAASHVLTYDEDEDDDGHFGGGENFLMPAVEKENYNKSSLLSSLFNLTTTMVGGGTLSIPYAIAAAGIILGPLIMLIVGFFAALSAQLLVVMSAKCASPSYKDIAIDAFGVPGAKTVEVVIVIFTWGAMAAYLVIMGDFIRPVLTLMVHGLSKTPLCEPNAICPWYFQEWFHILIWALCLCLPLGLLKKMSALKYTSVASLTATVYIVLVVVIRAIQYRLNPHPLEELVTIVYFNWDVQLFVALPILAIAFSFHMNIAPVQLELKNPTPGRVILACSSSVAIGAFLYSFMGVFGYLRFGKCVNSNVLSSFTDHRDILVHIGRIMFLLVVTTAFPLIVYPLRMNLRTLIFRTLKRDNVFHVVSTVVVLAGAYGVAISGVQLGLVLGVLGATCGNFLVFTFPGALYVKLNWEEKWYRWRKLYAYFAVGLGIVLCAICLYATIRFNNYVAPGC